MTHYRDSDWYISLKNEYIAHVKEMRRARSETLKAIIQAAGIDPEIVNDKGEILISNIAIILYDFPDNETKPLKTPHSWHENSLSLGFIEVSKLEKLERSDYEFSDSPFDQTITFRYLIDRVTGDDERKIASKSDEIAAAIRLELAIRLNKYENWVATVYGDSN